MVYLPNVKNVIIVSLAVALILCLLCKSCMKGNYEKEIAALRSEMSNKKSDTQTVKLPPMVGDWQVPILVLEGGEIPKPDSIRIDSFVRYEKIPVDTTAIVSDIIIAFNKLIDDYETLLSEYTVTRFYVDTARFKGAIGIVNAEVSGNRLLHIKQTLDSLKQTVITNTTTIPERPRVIPYIGLRGGYQMDSLIYVGGAFGVKLKNDMMIKASYIINTKGIGAIGGEIDIPLNKKRK